MRFLNEMPEAFDLMVCMPTLNKLYAETLQDCCEKLKEGLNISKSSEQHELSVQTKRLLFFLFQRETLYIFFYLFNNLWVSKMFLLMLNTVYKLRASFLVRMY